MANKHDLTNLKQKIEAAIRRGKTHEVRKLIQALSVSEVPRPEYSAFAGFARRAGIASWALRLLKPVVRPQGGPGSFQEPATPAEIAAYALALCSAGAVSEARWLVKQIENMSSPETLQACAYVNIWSWDYSRAAHFLKRYLQLPQLSEFQVTLARVNLAQAHEILGHSQKSMALVHEILGPARKMGWHLLERDALLLRAQIHIEHDERQEAGNSLSAGRKLSEIHGLDLLPVQKWLAIYNLNDCSPTNILAVEKLKREASHLRRWEVVRDLEYHQALRQQDIKTLDKLYVGTPFYSFRSRLLRTTKSFWEPPAEYIWSPNDPGPLLDLSMIPDGLCLKLIEILASDFYRPFSVGSLFAELYPEKHYDVLHSSHSIVNVISRGRQSLREQNSPFQIECVKNAYRLMTCAPASIAISLQTHVQENRFDQLRKLWPYQAFSAQQACRALGVDPKQVRSFLKCEIENGHVLVIGKTRSRLYRFISRTKSKAAQE